MTKPTNNRKLVLDFARRFAPNAVLDPPDPHRPEYHRAHLTLRIAMRDYSIDLSAVDGGASITATIHAHGLTLGTITEVEALDLLEHLIHQIIRYDLHHGLTAITPDWD